MAWFKIFKTVNDGSVLESKFDPILNRLTLTFGVLIGNQIKKREIVKGFKSCSFHLNS